MPWPVTLARSIGEKLTAFDQAWSRFWFQSAPTTPLEICRIGIGAALLVNYGMATPYLFDFWGDQGWMRSEGHRNILLDTNARKTDVGCSFLAGVWGGLATCDFGSTG